MQTISAEAASTADEVVPEAASTADEVTAEAAFAADEVAAEAASTADEVVADAASTADTDGCYCLVFFLFGWAHMLGIRTSRSKTTQWEYAQ